MEEGMTGIQWARVLVSMVVVFLVVELEKALVDPVLMPIVRPVLAFFANHSPRWLWVVNPKKVNITVGCCHAAPCRVAPLLVHPWCGNLSRICCQSAVTS
ncbi:hypothetical protein COO60DRAFT_1628274 [Scenedesmus sp. NREL 46B-D3]|nr:hypothetical protein COO60DRAFT_1628274 [Scenedesmus sp. NREL 46B-D3]